MKTKDLSLTEIRECRDRVAKRIQDQVVNELKDFEGEVKHKVCSAGVHYQAGMVTVDINLGKI